MVWAYRLMLRRDQDSSSLGIYEVFFDEYGSPENWTEEPVALTSDSASLATFQAELTHFMAAMELPVLDYNSGLPVNPDLLQP